MKSLYLLLLAAAVTPAFAQNTPAAKSSLNYNRIAVGYSSDDTLKGYNVTGSALLGGSFIISGVYDDVKSKGESFGGPIAGMSGTLSGFGLAYKFNVGPGDLAIGYSYKTGTVDGVVTALGDYVVASAEQKGFGLNYRQAINSSLEFSVGYSRQSTRMGFVNIDTPLAEELKATANVYTLGLRYNITKQLDASIDYVFKNENSGGDKFGVSVGYNF
jgi:hypothetical protein